MVIFYDTEGNFFGPFSILFSPDLVFLQFFGFLVECISTDVVSFITIIGNIIFQ